MYFSGQGRLLIGTRLADGSRGILRYVGNVPELNIEPAVEQIEHKESQSGQRLTDARMVIENAVNVSFPFESFDLDNLAEALYGEKATESADSVTDEALPDSLVNGSIVGLDFPNVSSVVIQDSNGTPATLTEDTHYRIRSAEHGTIEFLDVASFTQPFVVDYSYAAHDYVTWFSRAPVDRWLRFEGLNTADENRPVLVELYRVRLDPTSLLALISDEFGQLPLAGSALYDDTKVGNPQLGQFGRIILI